MSIELDRINKLKERFTDPAYQDDAATIQQWESELKELMVREKLLDNESIVKVIGKMAQDVSDMNNLLRSADSSILPDAKRDHVIDKRNMYQDFISLFNAGAVATRIQEIDAEVADNLASLPSETPV